LITLLQIVEEEKKYVGYKIPNLENMFLLKIIIQWKTDNIMMISIYERR